MLNIADRLNLGEIVETFAPKAERFLVWGDGQRTEDACDVAARRPRPFVFSLFHDVRASLAMAADMPRHPFLHLRAFDLGRSEGFEDELPSFASHPLAAGLRFDVAVIDGPCQVECALTAAQVVEREGIVVVCGRREPGVALSRFLFDTLHEDDRCLVLRPRRGASPTPPRTGERRLVAVPVKGEKAKREFAITEPFTRAYAAAVGADVAVVGEASRLGPMRLKSEALAAARDYDRLLVIDADVLIRPASPDVFALVPESHLGVFPEGRFLARAEWCTTLDQLYGLSPGLDPGRYFNSGVLVFSRSNIHVLEALASEELYGHPNYEQGFLNAICSRRGVPLHLLPHDLNMLPSALSFGTDWRFGFFVHLAGSGKRAQPYGELWADEHGDRRTFSKRRCTVSSVRDHTLREMAEQLGGRKVVVCDPTDLFFLGNLGFPLFDRDGHVVAHLPDRPGIEGAELATFGPYVSLGAGRWEARFKLRDGSDLVYDGAAFDVCGQRGEIGIAAEQSWPADGVLRFELSRPTDNVEIRIYRPSTGTTFDALWLDWAGALSRPDVVPEGIADVDGPP